jgi:hypothetical protein
MSNCIGVCGSVVGNRLEPQFLPLQPLGLVLYIARSLEGMPESHNCTELKWFIHYGAMCYFDV